MRSDEWLATRRRYIGGSDIAAIMGLSKWCGPFEAYCQKRGLIEPTEDSSVMEWGRRLEGVIVEKYQGEHPDCSVVRDVFSTSAINDFCAANADGLVYVGEDTFPSKGLECKTCDRFAADQWDGGVPVYYEMQCRWYMWIFDLPTWDVAVLIGGNDYREYTIGRDAEIEQRMAQAAVEFWTEHVEAGVPPEAGATSAKALAEVYPQHDESEAVTNAEIDTYAAELRRARKELAEAKAQAETYENRIKQHMAEAGAIDGQWWKATWRRSKDSAKIDWEAVARNLTQLVPDGVEVFERQAAAHTTTKPGTRRFVFKTEKE